MTITMSGLPSPEHAGDEPERPTDAIAGKSPTRIAMDRLRQDKIAMFCAFIVFLFVIIAIFAPLLCKLFGVELRKGTPDMTDTFGFPLEGPSLDHPFGIEPRSGNDLLAEWFYGARTSMIVATAATVGSTIIGVVIGLLSGFSRGWLDRILSWITDVFLCLPQLLMFVAVGVILIQRFGQNADTLVRAQFISLITVLTVLSWMGLMRLIRGEVFSLREREFVQSARVIGVPTRQVLFKELLPNMLAPIIISISLGLPAFVSAEAGLAYLGVGITGYPSWGQTVNRAVGYFQSDPLFLWEPVLGITVLVITLNLLGDSIRDAFDPKTRR
jgi:peptide/nickel transport system permease protein